MIVLGDGNPVVRITGPWVNRALLVANIVVFFAVPLDIDYAFLPAQLFVDRPLPPAYGDEALPVRLVTYMFFHSDLLHLLGNLLALWVFGDNVEDSMGHVRYVVFYLLCGVIAALVFGVMTGAPKMPLIGASGAIAGVMGAYLLLHPRARLLVLLLGRIPLFLPAVLVVGFQILTNLAFAVDPGGMFGVAQDVELSAVAWWAHLGGFAAGMALIVVMRSPGVPLFQPAGAYPTVFFPRLRDWLVPRGLPEEERAKRWRRWVFLGKVLLYIAMVVGIATLFGERG